METNKQIIFVNWRWGKISCPCTLSNDEPSKIVILSKFNEIDFIDHLKEQLNHHNPKEVIVLTHYNSKGNSQENYYIKKSKIIFPDSFKGNRKIEEFSKGEDFVYYGINNKSGLFYPKEEEIHIENIDKVWEYYWYLRDLEHQKKNLINLWLPLAIDLQGLLEVEIDKRKEYFLEIKKDEEYISYLYDMKVKWEGDKDKEPPENGLKEDIIKLLKDKSKEEKDNDLINKFDPLKYRSIITNNEILLDSFEKEDLKELPEWLKKLSDSLDKKDDITK